MGRPDLVANINSAEVVLGQSLSVHMSSGEISTGSCGKGLSSTSMFFAVKDLVDRCEDLASIRRVLTVIEHHPLSDHSGIGVTTNPVVTQLLESVLTDVFAYSTLAMHPTDESQTLIDQTNRILTRIGTSPKNACTIAKP